MPTTNVSVTTSWTKIAEAGEAFLLSANVRSVIQVATTTADAAPVIEGHQLSVGGSQDALTRDVIGAGYVWARTVGNWPGATLVLTK